MRKQSTAAKLGLWYEGANPWIRAVGGALPIVATVYLTAVLSYVVRVQLDAKQLFGVVSGGTLLLIAILAGSRRYFELQVGEAKRTRDIERKVIGQSHNFSDELIAQDCELIRRGLRTYEVRKDGTPLFEALVASRERISLIVERLYLVLEAHYSQSQDYITQINFEVTFMSKSYTDGELTIIAWRNRDRRAPRSLILREKDPSIYKNTVTANLYAAARPEPVIVSSTSSATDYHETYDGQKDRIRSTIVYPVLSDNNALLGTLVVHCDKDRFFVEDDLLFWRSLLEIYAKRIAHQKLCLDSCRSLDLKNWLSLVDSNAVLDLS